MDENKICDGCVAQAKYLRITPKMLAEIATHKALLALQYGVERGFDGVETSRITRRTWQELDRIRRRHGLESLPEFREDWCKGNSTAHDDVDFGTIAEGVAVKYREYNT